jgi:hypothetical protein
MRSIVLQSQQNDPDREHANADNNQCYQNQTSIRQTLLKENGCEEEGEGGIGGSQLTIMSCRTNYTFENKWDIQVFKWMISESQLVRISM